MLGSFTGREFASFDLRRKEMHYPSFAIFIAEKSWVPSPACAQGPIKRISTSPKILLKRIKIAWPFNIFLHTADGRPPNYLIKPDHLQHQNKNLMQWSSNFEDLPTLRITGLELIPQRTSLVWVLTLLFGNSKVADHCFLGHFWSINLRPKSCCQP